MNPKQKMPMMLKISAVFASEAATRAFSASISGGYIGLPNCGGGGGTKGSDGGVCDTSRTPWVLRDGRAGLIDPILVCFRQFYTGVISLHNLRDIQSLFRQAICPELAHAHPVSPAAPGE